MTDPVSERAVGPSDDHAPKRSRTRRILTRTAITLPIVTVVLVAGAYVATAVLDIPAPPTVIKLLTDAPSTQGQLYPSRTAAASATPRPMRVVAAPLPDTVAWKGAQVPVGEFLSTTQTNAFLIVRDGVMTHEWYRDGVEPTTAMASWSMAKSVVSLMIGRAIDAGKISEDDTLVDILPDLATGGDYDAVTVRNLLDMTSGIDVSENYNPYFPLTGTARMYLTKDLGGFVRDHRDLQFEPGSRGDYRSVDT
ncbi:CubicO group peptidase (beta-lactamase class C family) [Rhodococcus sp. 27YEA15]